MSDQKKPRKKKPRRPSYEEGEVRDKGIEEKMDPNYRRKDLLDLIKKATKGNTA